MKFKVAKGLRRYLGFMFRTRRTQPLVFYFSKPTTIPIHSLFVFFSFVAVWFDEENNIIDKRIIKPFSINIKSPKPFSKLWEIPL